MWSPLCDWVLLISSGCAKRNDGPDESEPFRSVAPFSARSQCMDRVTGRLIDHPHIIVAVRGPWGSFYRAPPTRIGDCGPHGVSRCCRFPDIRGVPSPHNDLLIGIFIIKIKCGNTKPAIRRNHAGNCARKTGIKSVSKSSMIWTC